MLGSSLPPGSKRAISRRILVAPFAKQMVEGGASLPVTPLYGQVQGKKTVSAMMQSILSGDETVDEATAKAAKEMDDVFAAGS